MSFLFETTPITSAPSGKPLLIDMKPRQTKLVDDAVEGLAVNPKTLPCKYFYDARGSELFEEITRLPEYYPTRTELGIMEDQVQAMARAVGPRAMLVEFGSGSGEKTERLLDALEDPVGCVLIDISKSALRESLDRLQTRYPKLELVGVCADYCQALSLPRLSRMPERVVAYFPGSTLGNFEQAEALDFLKRVHTLVGDGGGLLLGVDRVKEVRVLEDAYNDSAGVTSAFNKNLLAQLNTAGANFDLKAFKHVARYNDGAQRVEMHLVSEQRQEVTIGAHSFPFTSGETICTEYSHKYSLDTIRQLASASGMDLEHHWSDEQGWFSVCYLAADQTRSD